MVVAAVLKTVRRLKARVGSTPTLSAKEDEPIGRSGAVANRIEPNGLGIVPSVFRHVAVSKWPKEPGCKPGGTLCPSQVRIRARYTMPW